MTNRHPITKARDPALGAATVSAVVVSFNSRDVLERCLASLSDSVAETIVVDNASADGSAAFVRERFPDASLVVLDANVGYGAGANEGLARATGDYVLLLNADVRAEPGAVAELVACAAAAPRAAVVGPQLVGTDGSLQTSVIPFPTMLWRGRPAVSSTKAQLGRIRRRDSKRGVFLVGAALLLRRDTVVEVGGFDPAFFMYSEEVDLCYRLLKRGWSIEHCPHARFVHLGGASTGVDRPRFYREQLRSHLRFMRKHHGRTAAAVAHLVLAASLAARSVLAQRDAWDTKAALRWLVRSRTDSLLGESANERER